MEVQPRNDDPCTLQRVPFDQALSNRIDRLIIALDAQPRQPKRAVLKLRKRWEERNVPVWHPAQPHSTRGER